MIIIAHASENWGIGKNNSLMFKLPLDMKFFRETTSGGVVIMGRKTLESFPNQKPLPNRVNIVISRNPDFAPENVIVARSPEEAAELAKGYTDKKVFIIGGSAIYDAMLPYADTAYITKVFEFADADSFIQDFDSAPDWERIEQSEKIDDNGHTIMFVTYKRKQ